jgi:hypothetical protein
MRDAEYEGLGTGEVSALIADRFCGGDVHRMLRGDAVGARWELCRVLHDLRGWSGERIDRYYGFQRGEAARRLRDASPAAAPVVTPSGPELTPWEVVKAKRSDPRAFTAEHMANLRKGAQARAARQRRWRELDDRIAYDRAEHKRILSGG